jgi:hypothetical protein
MRLEYRPQSSRWAAFVVTIPDEMRDPQARDIIVAHVRLLKASHGNLTTYVVQPGGDWFGRDVQHSGQILAVKGAPVLAVASRSNWSGGGNWNGFVFGRPGDVVLFNCKGDKSWLIFDQDGSHYSREDPDAVFEEVR